MGYCAHSNYDALCASGGQTSYWSKPMTIIHVNPGEGQAGQAFMAKDRRKDRFLRMKAVTARTGMSISTIYRREIAGRFPRRMLIGLRSVAWYESDIDDFMADPMGYRWLGEAEVREAASGPG